MTVKLFGTDGIRGTANQYPITADIALKFGKAAGHYFKKHGYRNRVVIAKDTRLSGYMIEPALTAGFISVGMDVILVGPMPTPSVPMLIKSLRADLGVMISASHNPYEDNGLKLFNSEGFKLTDNVEAEIENLILNHNLNEYLTTPEDLGRAKRLDDAPGRYIEHVKRSLPKGLSLAGLRIVLDCANGAAYHLAPTIFWELGAEVIKIGTEPNGFNINQGCGSTHPEFLKQKVLETRADLGIALDGDADRVIMCDEKGHIIAGDHLIAIIAKSMQEQGALSSNKIVVTHMSNGALDEFCNKNGLEVIRAQIGDRYVSEQMRVNNINLGGEQSGHIILSDYSTTGDGMIAGLQVLAYMVNTKKKMSKIGEIFDLYPQLLKNVKYKNSNPLENKALGKKLEEMQAALKDCRVLIRKSGTEKLVRIMVEGKDKARIKDVVGELESLIASNCN
ncbi:MAG: phosphoglucosamine mutase [Rickettsiales bacterium]